MDSQCNEERSYIRNYIDHQVVTEPQDPTGKISLLPRPLSGDVVRGDFGERQEQNGFNGSNCDTPQNQRP